MNRLVKMELKRNRLNIYIGTVIVSFIVMLAFTYLIASVPHFDGNSEDAEMFMSYRFIVALSNAVCMGIFAVMSGVMASKFIVEEYTGKKAILLLSYPVSREKILNAKIFLVFSYTMISMLVCEGVALSIFFFTEMWFPLCSEKIVLQTILYSGTLLLCNSIMAGFVGIISLWFGFVRKSAVATIIFALIIVSMLCQLVVQMIAVPNSYIAVMGMVITVFAVAVMAYYDLCRRIKMMEV